MANMVTFDFPHIKILEKKNVTFLDLIDETNYFFPMFHIKLLQIQDGDKHVRFTMYSQCILFTIICFAIAYI